MFLKGLIFSVLLTFSKKDLHHSVPFGVVYQVKVIILNSIFIKNLTKSLLTLTLFPLLSFLGKK